jgi:tRNA/tmRNA/rRNA uracil-C5-methylase (TrmA/RlmC/RlmD family)
VEKLVYGGDGLARLNGRVIFAPFVLPGEVVRAEPDRQKPGMVQARTLEVLKPAAERMEPACSVFGRCGGCHYQHAPYEYQLAAKRDILVEELRRLGKLSPPARFGRFRASPGDIATGCSFTSKTDISDTGSPVRTDCAPYEHARSLRPKPNRQSARCP